MVPGNHCNNCEAEYVLDNSNTVVYYFENQPWLSFAATVCPRCMTSFRLFFREQPTYLEYFITHDFGFITAVYADDAIIQAFEECYELHPVQEYDLTPRMEAQIAYLAWLLDNDKIDPMDEFESPEPAHTEPEDWL